MHQPDPLSASRPSPPDSENTHGESASQGPKTVDYAAGGEKVEEPRFAPAEREGEVGRLGRYRVLKKIGEGGMGAVYLGYDESLQRKVALKVVLPSFAANRQARERFLREARTVAQVRSEYVVTIFDVGDEHGIPFLAMEYLQGSPLDEYLKNKGNLSLDQAIRIGRETALGLAAAHELGLVHRDIKPGNLWLEAPKGRVKILDFGLARREEDDAQITNSGAIIGTPAYMSPEQGRGEPVDHRSDLFSLGSVLYRLCTGQSPFRGKSSMALLTALAVDEPVPVRELNPELPERLAEVIHQLLAKRPESRFQTAQEVVDALDAIGTTNGGRTPVVVKVEPIHVTAKSEDIWHGIDDDLANAPGTKTLGESSRSRRSLLPWLAGGMLVVAAAVMLATVIIKTPKGTLTIESEDENVEIVVRQNGAIIRDKTKDREIELNVGDYTIELSEKKEGIKLNTDSFSIKRDGKETVRVRFEKSREAVQGKEPKNDPQRKALEWVLSAGGKLMFHKDGQWAEIVKGQPWPNLPLHGIDLQGVAKFDLDDVERLSDLPPLEWLSLWGLPVTDAMLEKLTTIQGLKELKHLQLTFTPVTNESLAVLKQFPQLLGLTLDQTKITNEGLSHVVGLKLATLNLHNVPIDDDAMTHIVKIKSLKGLWLFNTGVLDKGFTRVAELPNLEFIGATGLTDQSVEALLALKALTHLNIGRCQMTAEGYTRLAGIKNLEVIVLLESSITDDQLELISKFPLVKVIGLGFCPAISDTGMEHLAKCKGLTQVNLVKTAVTEAGVKKLAAALPACRIIWDGGTIEPKK